MKIFKGYLLTAEIFLIVSLLFLASCDGNAALTESSEPTVEVSETFNEPEAFLENELNTVEIVNAFGPSVVAINVILQGEPMRPFANVPQGSASAELSGSVAFS